MFFHPDRMVMKHRAPDAVRVPPTQHGLKVGFLQRPKAAFLLLDPPAPKAADLEASAMARASSCAPSPEPTRRELASPIFLTSAGLAASSRAACAMSFAVTASCHPR